jgi:hypothetical protein
VLALPISPEVAAITVVPVPPNVALLGIEALNLIL